MSDNITSSLGSLPIISVDDGGSPSTAGKTGCGSAEAAAAEPKRRGRPAGAKDKHPRRQKPRVVEVDITPPPSAQPSEPAPAPAKPPAQPPAQPSEPSEPVPEPEPMTPRRMYRETAVHLAHLKTLINSQKRQALGEMYTKTLMTLVQ